MNLSKTSVNRPVSTLMLMMIVVAFGIISFTRLPVDLFPKMELPMTVVVTNYPNAAPTEIETMVTRPIEQQVATTENISAISSYSMEGMSIVLAQFENGTDMNFAGLDIREKVELISDYLPDNATKPMVIAMNPNMLPISIMYVSADMDMAELTKLVDDDVLPALERVEGVASADSFGGTEDEIGVTLDQAQMEGYHLALQQVSAALQSMNISLPSGTVTQGSRDMIVRTVGEFDSIDDVKNMQLALPTKETVRLGDIAEVVLRERTQTSIGRVDSKPAIGISVNKQAVANTVQVSRKIDTAIKTLETEHPDIRINLSMNQADFVNDSIAFVAESALMGCLLAILICLFFLRSFASTMIIAISIPTSIIATFILMFATGFTMNMLSLAGLAVGIGMLVDDSIVVMENIFRRRGEGLSPWDASVLGAKEVTMPVIAATATKIAVFLPIVFVQSIAATIFKEFSFTISFALICSLVVALTVIPMLCSKLLGRGKTAINAEYLELSAETGIQSSENNKSGIKSENQKSGDQEPETPGPKSESDNSKAKTQKSKSPLHWFFGFIDRVIKKYTGVLKYSLKHKKTVVLLCVILLVFSAALVFVVGGELIPSSDEGALTIDVEVPAGTSIEKIDGIIKQVEAYVADNVDGLKDYSTSIGRTSMIALSSNLSNSASVSVNLVDKNNRALSTEETATKITEDLNFITGAKISISESNQMSMSMGGSPIQIDLKGDDFTELGRIADEIAAIVSEVEGTTNVVSSIEEGNPEVQVTPDRVLATIHGVSAFQIAQTLSSSLDGVKSTSLKVNGVSTEIVLSLSGAYGESIENLKQISMMTQSGQTVSVGDVADVNIENAPTRIQRQDQQRTVNVTGELSGRDLQSVTSDIEKKLSSYQMPRGYSYEIGGEAQEMQSSFTDLGKALLLSLLIIFMILASQFESLIQPFIVMLAIPFALTGAFLGLFITNTPLSLVAFLGIIMLSGIVVNNSILLVDFINQNRKRFDTRTEAIVAAGRFRFRPIIMTMLTTCFGLLPLAIGLGSGGELIQPMGITVIGGLIFSTVVTLVLVPVIYAIIDEKREKRRERRLAKLNAAAA